MALDLKSLTTEALESLADNCRTHLLEAVNKHGGHLAASLGVVELSIALHTVFNTPQDIIIWDVGHQAHVHKMLTGRWDQLSTLRQKDGLAPFPCRTESIYDAFTTGHASTAPSAGLGYLAAFKSLAKPHCVIAVIGDGGLTGGMAFEALNHAGELQLPLIVIYNDNHMSISPNVGALARSESIGQWIESMGFQYHYPTDGHHLPSLLQLLRKVQQIAQKGSAPQFVHVITQKGKGCEAAENDPIAFHAVKPNYLHQTTSSPSPSPSPSPSAPCDYSTVFGQWALDNAERHPALCVVTPAMSVGSGLAPFAKAHPQQFFDVGIAEQHCVTFAAGLAAGGLRPIVSLYSTFLQRAVDQIIHDVALPELPVIFTIDRAGLVGHDGATHMGAFDISLLNAVPNLMILSPSNGNELYAMLDWAMAQASGPIAIRYPKANTKLTNTAPPPIRTGKAEYLYPGTRLALLVFGSLLSDPLHHSTLLELAKELNISLIDMRFIKPLDETLVLSLIKSHKCLVTLEENAIIGGAGARVSALIAARSPETQVINLGLPDCFIPHASREEQLVFCQLDAASIGHALKTCLEAL